MGESVPVLYERHSMTRNLVIITVELEEPEREGANGNPALSCETDHPEPSK